MQFDLGKWLQAQTGEEVTDMPLIDVKSISAGDEREWLVANGLGSYASASISGANTRRYHGLLVAALNPPTSRTQLFSRIDEYVNGENISTNMWGPDNVEPKGFKKISAFSIYPCPTWVYELDAGFLIKQVFMLPGEQGVNVLYGFEAKESAASSRVALDLHVLLNYRDFHSETKGSDSWSFLQEISDESVKFQAFDGASELKLSFPQGSWQADSSWYSNYFYPREFERGLDDHDDAYHAGVLSFVLESGQTFLLRASAESDDANSGSAQFDGPAALKTLINHQNELLEQAESPRQNAVKRLVLAADQFIVRRESTQSQSIIAGYHWFNDWGRDAMISLPGLTLSTGRIDEAKSILGTFQKFLSEGMLPNNFPDSGEQPQYNTSDATLWWAWALKKYYAASGDLDFIKAAIPGLESVVDHHVKGTRYNLRMDENDGLISGGAEHVQLTWMDAKVGDYVVTPRQGKAVEISALWYSFLKTLAEFKKIAGQDGSRYEAMAEKTKAGFQAFWNEKRGCLYDVINEDGSKDDSVRPNQLMALSLEADLLDPTQQQATLKVIEAELLTPFGLRSLSPKSSQYMKKYGEGKSSANQYDRDRTYHQGTVWAWLLGPWVDARMNVLGENVENRTGINAHLALLLHHHITQEAGLGSISEIFDGDAPHKARGCVAQAWSVAELLRVFYEYPELQGLTRKELAMTAG